MTNVEYSLTVNVPQSGVLELVLTDDTGKTVATERMPYEGPVDNLLLTAVDNLLKTNSIDRSALVSASIGQGIDKDSSLYRIVQSFSSAVKAARGG